MKLQGVTQCHMALRVFGEGLGKVGGSPYNQNLCTKQIQVGDTTLPQKYFGDDCDIALGLSTDGFSLFKWHKLC